MDNNNTPARRARAVSFTAQVLRDENEDQNTQSANGSQATGTQPTDGDAASQTDLQSVSADPRFNTFSKRVDELVAVMTMFQIEGAVSPEACIKALDDVRELLEDVNGEYNANPIRCPLVNYREEHLIGRLCRHLSENLVGHEVTLWSWVVQNVENVTMEMRIASAKLSLIILECNEDVAHEIARSSDVSMEDLLREVVLGPRSELRTIQTGILGVLMTDHKSHETADYCVMPFEVDDPQNPANKIKVSLPYEISRRLSQEILPLFDNESLSSQERAELTLSLRCLSFMGEYNEVLEPVLTFDITGVLLSILQREDSSEATLYEALEACSRLLAHKSFADRFVRQGGVDIVLSVAKRAQRPCYLNPSIGWCLSGVAYLTQVFELVVRSGGDTVKRLVTYELSLLRGEQDLSKKNGLSFFAHAFAFPAILAQFDIADGCRTLLDMLSRPTCASRSIPVLNLVKHTTRTLRDYFRAHVAQVAYFLRHVSPKEGNKGSRAKKIPLNKPLPLDPTSHGKDMEVLFSRAREVVTFLTKTKWRPVEELLQYRTDEASSGVTLLLGLVKFCEQEVGHNAEETCTATLQVLSIASLLPIIHPELCAQPCRLNRSFLRAPKSSGLLTGASRGRASTADGAGSVGQSLGTGNDDDFEEDEDDEIDEDQDGFAFGASETGISVLLSVASAIGEVEDANPKSILAALQTLSNCVSSDWSGDESIHRQARALARNNNGVMILLALLNYKESPGDADPIRYYACNALYGISHEVEVADILKALNVDRLVSEIANSDPVVAEMSSIHQRLKAKALDLLNMISPGGDQGDIALAADAAARKIQRDSIVRRSNVQWNQRDLMKIIYEHLERHGCVNAARALYAEAGLGRGSIAEVPLPSASNWPTRQRAARRRPRASNRRRILKTRIVRKSHAPGKRLPMVTPSRSTSVNAQRAHRDSLKESTTIDSDAVLPSHAGAPSSQKRRIRHADEEEIKRMRMSVEPATVVESTNIVPATLGPSANPTLLERIVREHLLHQHQNCRNPISVPPPFSLLEQARDPSRTKHVCPGVSTSTTSSNLARRVMERSIRPPWGGCHGREMMTKTLYSKAKFSRQYNYGLAAQDLRFTSVAFRSLNGSNDQVLLGTETGYVHRYNMWSSAYMGTWDLTVHLDSDENFVDEDDFCIRSLESSTCGSLFLSNLKQGKFAAVWRVLDEDDVAVAFKIKDARCAILDVESSTVAAFVRNATIESGRTGNGVALYALDGTGEVSRFLPSEGYISNGYSHTNLCMTSGGALVCYDGVLWDARRTNRPIHKFDKLSDFGWGGLHPNGLQLLLDKDMWDLRTFRIVQSCSNALHGSSFKFDHSGDVVYSWHDSLQRAEKTDVMSAFSKSVVVTDASDYTSLASWNVDRPVYDLSLHPNGGNVALVVQTQTASFEAEGRLYEIGRSAPDEADVDQDEFAVIPNYPDSDTEEEEEDHHFDDDDEIGSGEEIVLDGDHALGEAFLRVINAMNHAQNHGGGGDDADWEDEDGDGDDDDEDDDGDIVFGHDDEDSDDYEYNEADFH